VGVVEDDGFGGFEAAPATTFSSPAEEEEDDGFGGFAAAPESAAPADPFAGLDFGFAKG
jgi:hypothetical protein